MRRGGFTFGSVDNSSHEALRPAACQRDQGILNNTTTDCTDKDLTGSREQAAGRRVLNGQHALVIPFDSSQRRRFAAL